MKLFLTLLMTTVATHAAEPFHIYAPSPSTKHLWIVAAKPAEAGLSLTVAKKVELGFDAGTITTHPDKPPLYLAAGGGKAGEVPAAVVMLDAAGGCVRHE